MQIASPFSQRNKKGKGWKFFIEAMLSASGQFILLRVRLHFFLFTGFFFFFYVHLTKIIFVAMKKLWGMKDGEITKSPSISLSNLFVCLSISWQTFAVASCGCFVSVDKHHLQLLELLFLL